MQDTRIIILSSGTNKHSRQAGVLPEDDQGCGNPPSMADFRNPFSWFGSFTQG